jgi:YD repeat-containing protein
VGTALGDILWIGGTGPPSGTGSGTPPHGRAPAGAFPDSIVYDGTSLTYTRTLRHGIKVVFDAQGRHIKTTGSTGQSTVFTWSGDTPTTVKVPPNGQSGTTYTLAYASGKLDKITDPAGRILNVTVNASSRLTSIVDPDTSVATQFGYDAAGRMTSRTTRRGYVTSYTYANSLRLTKAIVQRLAAVWDTTVFQPWDEKGLAVGMAGQNAIDTATASLAS